MKHRKPKLKGLMPFSILPPARLEKVRNSFSRAQLPNYSVFFSLILYLCVMFNLPNVFHQQNEKIVTNAQVLANMLAIRAKAEEIVCPEPTVKLQDFPLLPHPSLLKH